MLRVLATVLLALLFAAPAAHAVEYTAPGRPGPALSVPEAKLKAQLGCSKGVAGAKRAPVLLIQGTGANAKDNWSWTYEPALDKLGIPWCAIDLPDHATGDVQINGEYVVYAIRTMYAQAGRRIALIGHSQGGMLGRWALRFWPDTRTMVDDVIGFAPSNHGTSQASATCGDGSCTAADWQQWDISNFVKALNSYAETWPGISYTDVYTHTDEIVQPNANDQGSSSLHTGGGRIANVATQDICPNDTNEHLLVGLIDPVAYALAIDALDHDGPADKSHVPLTTCAEPFQPGIDPVTAPADGAAAAADYEGYAGTEVKAEPALACYTLAACVAAHAKKSACVSRRHFSIRFPALRGARATVDGRRATVRRKGSRSVVTVDLRGKLKKTVTVRVTGRDSKGRRASVVRRYRTCRPR